MPGSHGKLERERKRKRKREREAERGRRRKETKVRTKRWKLRTKSSSRHGKHESHDAAGPSRLACEPGSEREREVALFSSFSILRILDFEHTVYRVARQNTINTTNHHT
jgi:hypothetical protein